MQFYFTCQISYDKYLYYYKGYADKIEVRDITGQYLHVNAKYFKPYLTRNGINGQFRLLVDAKGNFISLDKV
ncbi:DUF2835 family protein [Shewanella intestini]|uniref:DUF2835 family protein n=1 Tax=Shewanella intestini TaxID=2017544 RepID=A0ABS5I383_9GAMM|nr:MULTISPECIES: DUF2835 family protein [Shewanella]MBR9727855.1 DUF2835 family protein [Shewanella intestini]MRG36152.1 DUF2835 family protein [Shewanella sp. XMDDZSB0408]